MKVLIIGGGFLGTNLYNVLSKEYEVFLATLNPKDKNSIKLDVTNQKEIYDLFENLRPQIVIHTVALTSSVLCEKEPKLARELNFESTKKVIEGCKKYGSKLFFISSSYIFEGKDGNYLESDEPASNLIYSKEKIKAEKKVLELENSVVLRVDLLYGYNGLDKKNSFIDSIINEQEITLGNPNQIRSPILLEDVANSISQIIRKNLSGIFHLAGDEKIRHLDFIKELSKVLGKKPSIRLLKEKDLLVKPLNNSSLNNKKAKSAGINFNSLNKGILKIKNLIERGPKN